MVLTILWPLALAALAIASPLRCRTDSPQVIVKNGTYAGIHSAEYGQDFFLGMPYAKAAKRFTVAESLDSAWEEVKTATEYPPHCIGYGGDNIGYKMSEDCLYLNVVRPAGSEDAKLPVAVWIHGGGLFMGGSADRRYNLSFVVENSVELGKPIIGVSLNYRLFAYGFLGGKDALDAGATNIGFRDQRLALRWVQENIAAFGGDPEQVTIFGESSGAESVTAQVFAYNGQHDGLFRGAIGQSGFGGILPRVAGGFNATDKHQEAFDYLVKNVPSCASTVQTAAALECLRTVDFAELNHTLATATGISWPPVMDGDFIADYGANQVAKGNFARVPILVGANTDEGSAFSAAPGSNGRVYNTDEDFRRGVQSFFSPTAEENTGKTVAQLADEALYVYPNVQSLGVPNLKTWPHVLQPNDSFSETRGLQGRRGGAYFGDLYMHYLRRRANQVWSTNGIPSFTYRFDVTVNPLPNFIGATHFQEVAFVFHNLNGDGYEANPFGGNPDYSEKARALSKQISTAWINFIVHQNPNGVDAESPFAGAGGWPEFKLEDGGGVGRAIVFDIDGSYVEMDDWRAEGMGWLIENDLALVGN